MDTVQAYQEAQDNEDEVEWKNNRAASIKKSVAEILHFLQEDIPAPKQAAIDLTIERYSPTAGGHDWHSIH